LAVALLAPPALSQQQDGDGDEPEVRTETRVFDIRSLLLEVPDYRAVFSDLRSNDIYSTPQPGPAKDESVFGQASMPASPPPEPTDQEENVEQLIVMIQDVIAPESWRDTMGGPGTLHYYGGQLVITNEAAAVEQVEHFLNLLKAARALRLRVDARLVVIPTQGASENARLLAGRNEIPPEEFRAVLNRDEGELLVARACVSGFEGQRIFTTSGRQQNVVVGAEATVASGASAYTPVTRQLVSGVTLELQAVLDPDQKTVLLDLRASLGTLMPGPAEASPAVDPLVAGAAVPPYRVAHFATSVSLPLDRFSLVGVSRYDDGQDVLLFVMPSRE